MNEKPSKWVPHYNYGNSSIAEERPYKFMRTIEDILKLPDDLFNEYKEDIEIEFSVIRENYERGKEWGWAGEDKVVMVEEFGDHLTKEVLKHFMKMVEVTAQALTANKL